MKYEAVIEIKLAGESWASIVKRGNVECLPTIGLAIHLSSEYCLDATVQDVDIRLYEDSDIDIWFLALANVEDSCIDGEPTKEDLEMLASDLRETWCERSFTLH